MSASEAAKRVDHDGSWLSRVERLETRPHPNDVRALLTVYGSLDTAQIEAVVTVARQAKQRGWWYKYTPLLTDWYDTYVGLETDATWIRTYESHLIPGLLQTADYARATIRAAAAPDPSADRVEQRVSLRLERQALLDADDPPQLRVALDEAALRRPMGGPEIMRSQIEHLLKLTERPNIQVQVLPFSTGPHAGLDGSFVILDFPPPPAHWPGDADDRVVYIDTLLSAIYLESPTETASYAAVFEQIRADALAPSDSREFLRTVAADICP